MQDNGVRINKFLSDQKLCSRRMADRLIEKGLVFINGKKASIGQKVFKGDKVEVKNKAELLKRYQYFLYNKPKGIVSHKTAPNEKEAVEDAGLPKSFAPVGRLDKASEGLMLLTNDGRIVNKILNPKHKHEKEYIVHTDKYIKNSDLKKLERGVNIEGYTTLPAKTKRISSNIFKIILNEGKKHQIRRMLAALGYKVLKLKRVRIMHLKLGSLAPGEKRKLTKQEQQELLSKLGI